MKTRHDFRISGGASVELRDVQVQSLAYPPPTLTTHTLLLGRHPRASRRPRSVPGSLLVLGDAEMHKDARASL